MKNALIAAAACVAFAAGASATSTGNMAGKINTKAASANIQKSVTVDDVIRTACSNGQNVTKVEVRTVPKFFAGRMVPREVAVEKSACN